MEKTVSGLADVGTGVKGKAGPPQNPLLAMALDYATTFGWPVFPVHGIVDGKCTCGKADCARPGKHPACKNGFLDATTDPEQIKRWWKRKHYANIGIPTGKSSGLLGLDVDPPQGEESLAELEKEHGPFSATVEVVTGQGRHLWLRHPGDGLIPGSAGKIGPGLDIRADGNYIIVPPSRHVSGRIYEFKTFCSPNDSSLAPLPAWLHDLAVASPQGETNGAGTDKRQDFASILKGVPKGERDEAIFKYACSRRSRGLSRGEVEKLVIEAARNCTPPFPENEALRKVDQAFKYEEPEQSEAPPGTYQLTDMGNAERLAEKYGQQIRFSKQLGWLVYDGRRWVADDLSQVQALAKAMVRDMRAEAASEPDEDRRQALLKFAHKSESAGRISAMVQLLPSEPGISVRPDVFDQNKMVLNLLNGTLDLQTGQLQPHSSEDLISKIASVAYNPDATCPRWEQFINEIMGGDTELEVYLQRLTGYSATGSTKEQVWAFLQGKGENGKSVFLNTASHVLSDYAVDCPANTFMEKRHDDGSGPRNDLARLKGARFVTASEPKGGRFDSETLKKVSGDGKVTARFLHKEFMEFEPEAKIFITANNRPEVRDSSEAFWRRIHLIPFTRQFTGAERDNDLADKLKAEASGILNWIVQGCLAWQETGLNPPDTVKLAVQEYRSDADLLGNFLEEHCVLTLSASVPVSKLYKSYSDYCHEGVQHALSRVRFNENLLGRAGISKGKLGPADARVKVWRGIGLRSETEGNVTRADFGRIKTEKCSNCDLFQTIACPPPGPDGRDPNSCKYYQPFHPQENRL